MNYIDYMKSGGIHIKEENKGKFTESARRAGKSVQEHATDVLNDPNATRLQKRRAQFAKNAKGFKHEEGGILSAQTGAKVTLSYFTPTDKKTATSTTTYTDTEVDTSGTTETSSSDSETTDTGSTNWQEALASEYLKMSGAAQQVVTQDPETGIYSQSGYSYTGNPKDPKGFRNNNWLNIRISNNNWQGKIANNTDGQFEQFETPELGIRAAARNIRTYGQRGLQTVKDIISTWAPASENNTSSYIQNVASRMGVDPNQTLDLNDTDTMVKLISAMTISENGKAGDESVIRRGVEMA